MKFSIQYFFNTFLYNIFRIYHRLLLFISSFQKKIENRNLEKEYYQPMLESFLKFISENDKNKSMNIDPIFYDQKLFNEFMKTDKNSLETNWKKRILMEFTPRGTIIMFYDAYKLGFSYYCDQNVMSYDILNAVAMKYVKTYRCYCFFMDEQILPQGIESPLKRHYLEDKKETKKNENFIKVKNYKSDTKMEKKDEKKETMKNKFIYIGNIRNFKILQPITKNNIINSFTSTLLNGITSNLSYNEFKLLKKNPVISSIE